MNPTKYVENAVTTESLDKNKICERLADKKIIRLLHAAMGLATEAGEFVDQLKKHIFYGRELDPINLIEEIGDSFWYIAIALDELRYPMEEVFERNIKKLQARYRGKFSETKAQDRNLGAERKILEGKCDSPWHRNPGLINPCPSCGAKEKRRC